MLKRFLKSALGRPYDLPAFATDAGATVAARRPRVLNVGGGSKRIAIPAYFDGWEHVLLDIAPGPEVDVVQDARRLSSLPHDKFDAVYCSHNLEHYYKHEVRSVLEGFLHVIREDGFAEIRVPDMHALLRLVAQRDLDIEDPVMLSDAGPISVHDIIYGYGKQLEASGVDFYAHKCGFTPQSLRAHLNDAGFGEVVVLSHPERVEVQAFAFKCAATPVQRALLFP